MDLRLALLRGRVRPILGGPADVLRRDGVGRASTPASDAAKLAPFGPVLSVHLPAPRTSETCVSRVDQIDPDTLLSSFVLNDGSQLTEGPGMKVATLGLPGSDPGADFPEILEGDPASSAFGLRDQVLGNGMIDV
jgi:hypothetical protein